MLFTYFNAANFVIIYLTVGFNLYSYLQHFKLVSENGVSRIRAS